MEHEAALRRRVESFDWGASAAGPRASWPFPITAAVELCLAAPFPAMVFAGASGVQIYNDACVAMLGTRHPAALGQTAAACWSVDYPAIVTALRDVMREGTGRSDDLCLIDPDGERYIRFAFTPLADAAATCGAFCTLVDTSAQIQLARLQAHVAGLHAESAAAADLQFRDVAEAVPQMVFTARANGEIDYLNREVNRYTGRVPDSIRGWNWEDVVHPEDYAGYADAWRQALDSGGAYQARARLRRHDGVYRWFLTRGVALREAKTGAVVRWFGTGTDIDDLQGAAERDSFLARAEAVFSATLEHDEIIAAVAHEAVVSFSDYCLIDIADDAGRLVRTAADHRDPARRAPFQHAIGQPAPPNTVHPISVVWRTGKNRLVPLVDAAWMERSAGDDTHLTRMRAEKLTSLISVGIAARGRRFGVLTFCRSEGSTAYGDNDLATAEDLARRIGASLENARLYREARESADAQRAIAEREKFYAELGEVLAKTLDLTSTLDAAIRLLVPKLADWVIVNLLGEDGEQYVAAAKHRDPANDAAVAMLAGKRIVSRDAPTGSPLVVRTQQPVLYHQVPYVQLQAIHKRYSDLLHELRVHSAAVVPIAYGGQLRGTLTVMYDASSGRHFADEDVAMFLEVARRISPAIANAEAYQRERRVARTFQEAALTTDLPRVSGMTFDALYEAGRSEGLVGGDWYDAFRVPDGRIVLSVGDVAGSGLDAAATMAAIRQSLRGAAAINPDPSVMLDAADRVLRSHGPENIVTAWVGVVDPVWSTLACAGAGHPPPLRRTLKDGVRELPAGGLPLGLRERGLEQTKLVDLEADTALLLYTDGLIEATRDLLAGEAATREAFREARIDTCPAQAIHDAVLGADGANDDVALLVVAFEKSLFDFDGDRGACRWAFDATDGMTARKVRGEIVAALQRRGISLPDRTVAEVVFSELVGNVKRYAPGPLEVALDLSGENPVVHVVDNGDGFQHNARLPADALAESGRGLFIVAAIAEEFAVTRCSTGGAHARAVLRGRLR